MTGFGKMRARTPTTPMPPVAMPAPSPAMPVPPPAPVAPARRGRGIPWPAGGSSARPASESARPADDGRLRLAREQVAGEVAALLAAKGAPEAERLRLLADLATRLDALLAWLDGALDGVRGASGYSVELAATKELAGLVARLRACEEPGSPRGATLQALWDDAIRLLTGFARPEAGAADRGTRGSFWKRGR
jgi:hypothetical protein